MLIRKFSYAIMALFVFLSCGKENVENTDGENSKQPTPVEESDTIDYRALVLVEESDLKRYGGERIFKQNLEKMFYNTTRFWNESTNKFDYFFRWVPAGLKTYKIDGKGENDAVDASEYDKVRSVATEDLDPEKYDYVVFFALGLNKGQGGLSCGGSGKGFSVVWAYIEKDHNIFTDAEYPNQGTYSNLGHEYGHVRGAQDLYQYKITADNNSINHEAYPYPPCNMGTGYMEWSDYCSVLFNYNANMKRLPDGFDKQIFPETVTIRVLDNGKPANRVTVNLWGTRAGGKDFACGVWDKYPFLTKKTSSDGEVSWNKVYEMYNYPDRVSKETCPPKSPTDEFPFSRWYCFLVEAFEGTDRNAPGIKKGYAWLSDLDIVPHYVETGEDNYVLEISIK